MLKSVALAGLLLVLPGSALACTLLMSPAYKFSPGKRTIDPVAATVVSAGLTPWIDGCDAGFMVVTLGGPRSQLMRQGYWVRPISGVHAADAFPTVPLAAQRSSEGSVTLAWAWDSIIPDPDGHVRWHFEIVPISPSGDRGHPIPVCASTDNSCPANGGVANVD